MISHAWVENAKNFFEDVLKSMFRNEASAAMKSKCDTRGCDLANEGIMRDPSSMDIGELWGELDSHVEFNSFECREKLASDAK